MNIYEAQKEAKQYGLYLTNPMYKSGDFAWKWDGETRAWLCYQWDYETKRAILYSFNDSESVDLLQTSLANWYTVKSLKPR